jgi:hypothetical protein
MTEAEAAASGNPRAKMLAYLLAEGAMKCVGSPSQGDVHTSTAAHAPDRGSAGATTTSRPIRSVRQRSLYRDTYEAGRLRYAGREDWTDAHRHAAALRLTAKAILVDLWEAAD